MEAVAEKLALNILVVDDDDLDRERVRRLLRASNVNANIQDAESGAESISLLSSTPFDCVIVDYHLGDGTGIELLQKIHEITQPKIAVIMVTGLGDEQLAAEAMRLGASDYLTKSQLQSPQLLKAILNAIHKTELEQKLYELAHYDQLTGLASRHLLRDRLQQVIAQSERMDNLSALAFIDLDNFKPVNDRYGHESGDKVLIEIAHRLKKIVRSSDTVSRIGGDEFVLLLIGVQDAGECRELLLRVQEKLIAPIPLESGLAIQVSASIGVTLIADPSLDADTVLRRADQTMYKVKSSGRNNILFFDPEEENRVQQQLAHLGACQQALDNNQFILYYQPKIALASGEVVGVEALIRWQHPTQGLLAPAAFSDALDHPELGSAIGSWVIRQALWQMQRWTELGLPIGVSVNISASHIQQEGFVELVEHALAEFSNVSASLLELEVLETVAVEDMTTTVNTLQRCRALGVRVALDDFGTGFSSLSYLKRLPLDTLKIDREFVQNMLVSADDRAIVESVISLSHAFGYQVVAEGVETKEHEYQLKQLRCGVAQGYAISKPIPAEQVAHWVFTRNY